MEPRLFFSRGKGVGSAGRLNCYKKDKKKQKKQKTTKKDETTTGSGKTGKRNSSGISPKTGSNIIIPIAGLLVAVGAIVVSRKELTDKN